MQANTTSSKAEHENKTQTTQQLADTMTAHSNKMSSTKTSTITTGNTTEHSSLTEAATVADNSTSGSSEASASNLNDQHSCQPRLPPHWQPKWQPKYQPKSRQNSRKQPTSSRNQQQLDRQIWQLHQAIVEKILQQPAHAGRLLQQLENRYQQGQLRHAQYLFWSSCLLQVDQPDLFRQAVLSNQPQAIKYRRRTALTGVLTEHERQTVLFAGVSTTQNNPND